MLDAKRDVLADHQTQPDQRHDRYATGALCATPPRYCPTYVVLAEQFLKQFRQRAAFLESLLARHKVDPTRHLHGIMELASLYDAASLERALLVAAEYNTYSHTSVRSVLEHKAEPSVEGTRARRTTLATGHGGPARPESRQRILEVAR